MANIRKSFNFRSGLQVDNDNFVVNETGNVGIGTSTPQEYLLNVYGDKALRVTGLTTTGRLYAGIGTVGVLSATSADVSGILTVGQLRVGSSNTVDNLIGYGFTAWITNDSGVGLHTLSRVGIGTTATPTEQLKVFGDVAITTSLTVGSATTIASYGINTPSGIVTASSFVGVGSELTNLDASNVGLGTLSNSRLPQNISVSGVVTATSFVGSLTGTATSLTGTPDITVGVVSATNITASNINATGIITASKLVANSIEVPNTGITTVSQLLHVGTGGTAFAALSSGRIGVGTAEPTSEIQVRKASGSLVEVISDSGQARISVGQSVGAGKSTGVIRFGNSAHDFDIINNDNEGDINFLLNGNGSAGTGKFSWQDGNSFTEVMSLNANGNFSVSGVTTLASAGGTTTTGGALYVNGTVTATNFIGNVSLQSIIASNVNVNTGVSTVTHLDIVANANPLVSAKLTLDPNATVGLGTSQPIVDFDARDKTALFGSVGINTTDNSFTPSLYVAGNVAIEDSIGIGTTASITGGPGLEIHTGFVDLYDTRVSIESINTNVTVVIDDKTNVGIGSTQPKAAVDLSLAGKGGSSGQYAYLILPKVTNFERSGFASTESGAIIFNTDTSTFQGYTGIGWTDLH